MREGLLTGPRAEGRTRVLSGPIFSGPVAYANLVNFFQAIEIALVNHVPAEHFDFRDALRKEQKSNRRLGGEVC
jgi:hypothetical protein